MCDLLTQYEKKNILYTFIKILSKKVIPKLGTI